MDIRDAIGNNTAIEAISPRRTTVPEITRCMRCVASISPSDKENSPSSWRPLRSGKSTLMHTLAGLDCATGGHIIFNGDDLTRMNDNQLTPAAPPSDRFIFQSFNLLPMFTAEQNILMPLTLAGAKPDRQWLRLLVELGLKNVLTIVRTNYREASGSDVAIARALIANRNWCSQTKPTGNLDSVSSAEVLSFLKRSVNELGQTIIMVTHDAVAASYADRALVFADGQIVADVNKPTADQMSELLMKEREAATMNVASARHSR